MIAESLLNQKCYIAHRVTNDEYTIVGEEQHGTPIEYKCRIDYNVKLTFNQSGTQVPSVCRVFVNTDISEHDWVYLESHEEIVETSSINRWDFTRFDMNGADGDVEPLIIYGQGRKPLQVNHLYDGAGNFHHCEVFL